ncbi:MAG: hypothetical protein HYT70_02810 [Candidatus Aenigmarchaeota archaeon]|nr:hypothetical protein [Candidatus Aenigmarchaeota archaeon]
MNYRSLLRNTAKVAAIASTAVAVYENIRAYQIASNALRWRDIPGFPYTAADTTERNFRYWLGMPGRLVAHALWDPMLDRELVKQPK